MHVVVTGASSGIGEALVREYVKQGAAVTMVARRQQKMQEIAEQVGGKTQIFARDLSKVESVLNWLEPAEESFGPIDVFINNAGMQIVARLVDTDPDWAEQLLTLDLDTPLLLTRTILPKMLERNSGAIVNIASLAGIAPTPGMFYYNAAKAGLGAASESLYGELRLMKSKVHVLTVYPGPVATPMAEAAYETLGSPKVVKLLAEGTTEVLATKIRKRVDRRKSRLIYPWIYSFARSFPGITRWVMDRFSPLPEPQQQDESVS